MKRVLIITYYWPPSGGSGVQRWLYFTKHLRHYGWEPVIYTVCNGEFPYLDQGLEKHIPENLEVIKGKIWEPYTMFRKVSGQKEKVNPSIFSEMERGSWFKKLLLWIRGNFFIPDARMFWIRPSVRLLENYLKQHPVDFVVSTGPPHSVHLIAKSIKRKLNLLWLADFRDPWTQIYSFKQLNLSYLALRIHKRLEKSVLNAADLIVTVSQDCKKGLEILSKKNVNVVTNGYEEFEKRIITRQDQKLKMIYTGVLSADRNPIVFWKVLEAYLHAHPSVNEKFELQLIGNIDHYIIQQLENSSLKNNLFISDSIPHEHLQNYLFDADILLLVGVPGNKGVITGKFFEYLYLQKPIFSISPIASDVSPILVETGAGLNSDFEDFSTMQSNLHTIVDYVLNQNFKNHPDKIAQYSRKNLAGVIARLMDSVSN